MFPSAKKQNKTKHKNLLRHKGGESRLGPYRARRYQNFAFFPPCNHCSSLFCEIQGGLRPARPEALTSV